MQAGKLMPRAILPSSLNPKFARSLQNDSLKASNSHYEIVEARRPRELSQ